MSTDLLRDSVPMPVLAPTDLTVSRLPAKPEHHRDVGALLPVTRGLRERIECPRVFTRRPIATAFLYLLELLDVLPHCGAS
ncbi:hypothetical protein ACIBG6_07520 [Streptomyces sp. NPDC050842]|uniref:hypothetical protein n=1 Tax=Streptomyces sp. NPDC050842 TaxID=3365636 RepID=UPI0037BA4659